MKNTYAFTLAEVLITLGIVGVVAAMTISTVIQEYKVKSTVTKLKRSYSILTEAVNRAIIEYGSFDTWGLIPGDEPSLQLLGSRMKNYLNIVEDCGTASSCQNYDAGKEKFLHGRSGANSLNFSKPTHYKLLLADGILVSFRSEASNLCTDETSCFGIYIDINGKQKPNQMGIDIFALFGVYPSRVGKPTGYGFDPSDMTTSTWNGCNLKREGWACTAWVIYNENMDYLKCADKLTWDGQTKCK